VGRPGAFPHEADLGADPVGAVAAALARAARKAEACGVAQVVLDPGFGFGKGTAANLALLHGLDRLAALGRPVLVGLSRKRTAGVVATGDEARPAPVDERLYASLGLAAAAVARGAMLVRTHDVRATVEVLRALGAVAAAGAAGGPDT
jgi:dihydropteroate synthase